MTDYTQQQIDAALAERDKWPPLMHEMEAHLSGDDIACLWLWHRAQLAAETERCAKVCETCNIHDEGESRTSMSHASIDGKPFHLDRKEIARERIAAAIRAERSAP